MAESYPYPAAEHYVEPTNSREVLTDEMRLYRTPVELRGGVMAVEKLYKNTFLFDSFRKFALLNVKALSLAAGREVPASAGGIFYEGEVLAAHAKLKSLSPAYRQRVLWTDFFEEYPYDLRDFDNEDVELIPQVEELVTLRQNMWEGFCQKYPPDYQEKLVEVTTRMYGDLPDSGRLEDQFMSGFLFGDEIVLRALSYQLRR